MTTPGATVDRDRLEAGVAGTVFAGRVVVLGEVTSTIRECLARADAGADEGVVVIADVQSDGRGQRGNAWLSPPGAGVYLSALLRPPLSAEQSPILTAMAGLAACTALRDDLSAAASIKRPNDLLVDVASEGEPPEWRKLGGVLVNAVVQGGALRHAVVSVGLNVTLANEAVPPHLRDAVTSLHAMTGHRVAREDVAAAVLRQLSWLHSGLSDETVAEWSEDVTMRHRALVAEATGFTAPPLAHERDVE